MSLQHIGVLALVSFLVTLVCIPLVKKLAWKVGAIDYPSARRVNTKPIPRLGGVAICAGIFAAFLLQVIGELLFNWSGFMLPDVGSAFVRPHLSLPVNYLGVLGGLFVVALVGAIDDVKSLSPGIKMLGQIIGAVIIACSGVLLMRIANPIGAGYISFGLWSYPITVFYLVAFMNVINLIDGLDGLAGGIVAIASVTMFAIAITDGREEVAMISLILLGAVVAFMRFNFSPASIFMGDSGALLMGALLGVISLLGVMRAPAVIVLAAPLTVAAIPIADTVFAIFRRAKNHQPIQQADKGHLHHRLLREGYSTRKAVTIIHGWTVLLAIGAYAMSFTHGVMVFLVFAALLLVSFVIMWRFRIFTPILRHHYHGRETKDSSEKQVPQYDDSPIVVRRGKLREQRDNEN